MPIFNSRLSRIPPPFNRVAHRPRLIRVRVGPRRLRRHRPAPAAAAPAGGGEGHPFLSGRRPRPVRHRRLGGACVPAGADSAGSAAAGLPRCCDSGRSPAGRRPVLAIVRGGCFVRVAAAAAAAAGNGRYPAARRRTGRGLCVRVAGGGGVGGSGGGGGGRSSRALDVLRL